RAAVSVRASFPTRRSSDLGLLRPFSAVFDRGGDDLYSAGERPYALGGAHFGVAALIDLRGNDVYRGDDGSLGASCFGVGLLYDGDRKSTRLNSSHVKISYA